MRHFYLVVSVFCLLMAAPSIAYAQSDEAETETILYDALQQAMEMVAQNELEAPAASRIYAITAIALHDSWAVSEGDRPYITANRVSLETETETETETDTHSSYTLMSATVQTTFAKLFPDSVFEMQDIASNDLRLAEKISKNIIAKLEKPTPIYRIEEGQTEPLVHPEWRFAPLLELSSPNKFRPAGPPVRNSIALETAINEVKRLGEDVSEYRLADDSLTAAFWGDAVGTETPPGHWNQIALDAIKDRPFKDQIEIILALNIALYDAGIAGWDAKYHYNYPRPDVVIRETDPENRKWKAMGEVPLHPEYVSGHSTFSGAAASVLTSLLGDESFCSTSKAMWDLTRCFSSFTAAAAEAGQSRIYGGIHYQFSNQDGLLLGHQVAENTLLKLRTKGIIRVRDKKRIDRHVDKPN